MNVRTFYRSLFAALALAVAAPALAVVPSTANRNELVADGSTNVFSFTFKALDKAHVEVLLGGVKQSSGFRVEPPPGLSTFDTGGRVTFIDAGGAPKPPAVGTVVRIQRTVPFTQGTSFPVGGAFPSKVVERTHDLQAMGLQQLDRRFGDLSFADIAGAATSTQVPLAATAAALAAAPTACSGNDWARGVQASGNAICAPVVAVWDGGTATGAISAPSYTATATSGQNGFFLASGAGLCFDGATCDRRMWYSSGLLRFSAGGLEVSNGDVYAPAFYPYGQSSFVAKGRVADGAAAVGAVVDNTTALSTSGAKLVSFRNAGVEKASIDRNGAVTAAGFVGPLTGNASSATTATALAANGTNCPTGQAAGGISASGNAEDCYTPAGGGDSTVKLTATAQNNTLSPIATGLAFTTTAAASLRCQLAAYAGSKPRLNLYRSSGTADPYLLVRIPADSTSAETITHISAPSDQPQTPAGATGANPFPRSLITIEGVIRGAGTWEFYLTSSGSGAWAFLLPDSHCVIRHL